ncbi:MAG: transglutaminase-like domain-containing protein [Spirochaetota bacterium]
MNASTARILGYAILAVSVLAAGGCRREGADVSKRSTIVTRDISAGIEKHIADKTRLGGGYFPLDFGTNHMRLKLVRVHTEYLANLGPRRHFACVDLVDTKGDVYDVDFFLSGGRGNMVVTETTVHKMNGQPYYAWKQKPDGGWGRVPPDKASQELLGVKRGSDRFEFIYRAELPEITHDTRVWLPIAVSDRFQTVEVLSIHVPGVRTMIEKSGTGKILFLAIPRGETNRIIEIRYHVLRAEKSAYADATDIAQYLKPDRLVPITGEFKRTAKEVLAGKNGDLVRARALYDHVIERMRYMKYGTGWGKGDAVYACDVRTGNCTDFHAYFIALSRAAGIPARFAIGAAIPSERNDGGIDGYHCWAEFHAEGKWWPVDISEADKYSSLATYYFGHHPANRFELSRGRDIIVSPLPASGPINFLAYPIVEMNGTVRPRVEFSFIRKR